MTIASSHWRRVLRAGAPATPLHDLAAAEGWPRIADEPRRHHDSRRLSWSAGAAVQVHLLEFYPHALRTVVITGEEPGGPVATALDTLLDHRTVDEIFADATAAEPRRILAGLYALTELGAATAGDPRLPTTLTRALEHPEFVVRAAALRTAPAFQAWPGLRDAIEARRPLETELAELIEEMLSFLDEEAEG
ncbi:hypothetical protein [Phytomonospora endophytica]|uniref:Uncharacterized protein n=1 Tax=Phytomonospora endophytica TaxID=714109 RepID=A0A841FRK8_9ACTN|nr:hypothetical protein [Phytomonospora endophytica]MBB6036408.1 hypothetical protein [Phytomonospora endophytica]GIG65730.1 hypothetical protein Pen01_20250 [Phytomonospora endophytica]